MLHEMISSATPEQTVSDEISHRTWVYFPRELLQQNQTDLEQPLDQLPEQPHFTPHLPRRETPAFEPKKDQRDQTAAPGHSLFQEMFFFCTVKKIADLPGSGCIYVELVVDADSGVAFAKVYPGKHAVNAVNLLSSKVLPFFARQGLPIRGIHTRNTSEYCGLPPVHPYETFLAGAHIPHLPMEPFGQPCNFLCEEFYRRLLKDFFPAALRKRFPLALRDLQKELDVYVEAYNAAQIKNQVI